MSQTVSEAAVLLADITGSTALYERLGDAAASGRILDCIDRLKRIVAANAGEFVLSKGDDILALFADPSAALAAARAMVSLRHDDPLAIHAGVHFGSVVRTRGDMFGDTVNVTARLAALANADEVLLSRDFVAQLPDWQSQPLRLLDRIRFKGKDAPIEIYSLTGAETGHTIIPTGRGSGNTRLQSRSSAPGLTLELGYGDRTSAYAEGRSLSLGRAPECDIVIARPWVSRQHATVSILQGRVELDDRSSGGTFVSLASGHEFFIRREKVVLTESGLISPVKRPSDCEAEIIQYQILLGIQE